MSQFIKFYFTSSMLNMFWKLIHPSSGACDISVVSPHWSCVLVSMRVGVSVGLVGVVSVYQAEAVLQPAYMDTTPTSPTETPTRIETRTQDQCGDTTEKSQAPDDGCINPLTPNDPFSGCTALLTSKCCILYIYSTNTGTEYFKHGIYSPFFPLQNAVCFIILTYLVPDLFTFYMQDVLKFKKIILAPKG